MGWGEQRESLCLYFIDPQKAHYLPPAFGVPPRMIAVIRKFHDGMRACVQNDNGIARVMPRVRTISSIIQHLLRSCCPRRPTMVQ